MAVKWMIVANRAGARFIEVGGQGRALELRDTIDNPRGRLHDGDLDADRPGRAFDSAGEGRHALSREESASERVAANFARKLASRLSAARKAHEFDELVLVAEARFLGLLRGALDDATSKSVVTSVDKDLVAFDLAALPAHLGGVLAPARPR